MSDWRLVFTRQAAKDAKKFKGSPLKPKIQQLLDLIARDPFTSYPPYEKLTGNLAGAYSRRVNVQHRIVYHVLEDERVVHVLRLWTHYE